jgi:hypothetical protein
MRSVSTYATADHHTYADQHDRQGHSDYHELGAHGCNERACEVPVQR